MSATAQVVKNRKVYVREFDLSGDENDVTLQHNYDEVPAVVHGDKTRVKKAGLEIVEFSHRGFTTFGTNLIDDIAFTKLKGAKDIPVSCAPQDGNDGSIAYFFRAMQAAFNRNEPVGQLPSFDMSMPASDLDLIRGTLMHSASAPESASGNGVARQLGAVAAGKKLYAILHLFAFTGTSLDVKVTSDNASGFGTPADQLTFTQLTAAGSEFPAAVAGPITDDWWRVEWTLVGSSALFAVAVGIR